MVDTKEGFSMDTISLPKHEIANGPEGLTRVLKDFLKKSQQDLEFAAEEHYVLYQQGNQKSLIKVDMSQHPYLFWYYDLMGRPITKTVKETISQFLWDNCENKELYFEEIKEGE